jgi:hypothetical protein
MTLPSDENLYHRPKAAICRANRIAFLGVYARYASRVSPVLSGRFYLEERRISGRSIHGIVDHAVDLPGDLLLLTFLARIALYVYSTIFARRPRESILPILAFTRFDSF